MRSEESIFREASKKIESIVDEAREGPECLPADKNDKNVTERTRHTELEKQVLIGEITPFQAIAKQSSPSKAEGYKITLNFI